MSAVGSHHRLEAGSTAEHYDKSEIIKMPIEISTDPLDPPLP